MPKCEACNEEIDGEWVIPNQLCFGSSPSNLSFMDSGPWMPESGIVEGPKLHLLCLARWIQFKMIELEDPGDESPGDSP